jgi:hypothetical protein
MEIFLGLAALVAILYYGYLRFFKTDTTDLKEPAVVADKPVEPAAPVVEVTPEPVAEKAPEPVVEVTPEPVAVAQTVAKVKSSTPRAKKKK